MPESLYWTTVTPVLKSALTILMESDRFQNFRLVGGTCLSLQLGHRRSDDIDLFTDAEYGSVNFDALDNFLRQSFQYVSTLAPGPIGMGKSYLIGANKLETVKLDLFYTDPFIDSGLHFGPHRLASLNEIVAMKVDIVQRKARKKDFWDLHELLSRYSIDEMIKLHAVRYPYHHEPDTIRHNFIDFNRADEDFDPICLLGKYWELIKLEFSQELRSK
jgi:predicted nucleotidyltransferase component of viral defense system